MAVIQLAVPAQSGTDNRFRMLQSMAKITQALAQSVASTTNAVVAFTAGATVEFNTDGMWNKLVNPTQLTAPIAGKYLLIGRIQWDVNATGGRLASFRKNGGPYYAETTVQAAGGALSQS